jgi:Ca2+-binding RTX toxin-like protein
MATATVSGGNNVSLSLSGADLAMAKDALATLSSQFASSSVQGIPLFPGSPTVLDVLNVNSDYTHNVTATPDLDAIVVTGDEGTRITGNSTVQLIAGGRGADTINAAGAANVTIVGGGGGDVIQLNSRGMAGGDAHISLASGNDTVRMWGGNATITGSRIGDEIELNGGTNHVVVDKSANFDINGGDNTIVTGGGKFTVTGAGSDNVTVTGRSVDIVKSGPSTMDLTLNSTVGGSYDLKGDMTIHQMGAGHHELDLSGNDTVYLGAGNVDITNTKGTTVFGGSGRLNFEGSGHGNDSVMAGSGSATILGGGGFDTIIGGSGALKADGGDGKDLLVGGSFKDTLTGGAGADSFRFVNAGGPSTATHVITDFTHGMDKIDLSGGGYTMADISSTTIKAGSTVIKLNDGTQITLKNFTNLSASDFS